MKKLSLAFSPCPNDTFIFDAMIHGKIDTEGLEFDYEMKDVEYLNKTAFENKYDISKLSFHAYAFLYKKYILLNSGAALGNNCGPLLICRDLLKVQEKGLENCSVGIPGIYTTAHFLLNIFNSKIKNKEELLFSEIENAVLNGKLDAGVIIHENRFTYADRGLSKIADLGEYWENQSGFPIPLGAIAVKRNLQLEIQLSINSVIKRSIQYAFENPGTGTDFIKKNASEMSEEVMYKHINLYVNKYSEDLGENGKRAIKSFYQTANKLNILPEFELSIFVK